MMRKKTKERIVQAILSVIVVAALVAFCVVAWIAFYRLMTAMVAP